MEEGSPRSPAETPQRSQVLSLNDSIICSVQSIKIGEPGVEEKDQTGTTNIPERHQTRTKISYGSSELSSGVGVIGSSRKAAASMQNSEGSVSGKGNCSVSNFSNEGVGEKRIGDVRPVQIPEVETTMGFLGSQRTVENGLRSYGLQSSAIGLGYGRHHCSAQRSSEAGWGERRFQPETVHVKELRVGSESSSQIPTLTTGFGDYSWSPHDQSNEINSIRAAPSFENSAGASTVDFSSSNRVCPYNHSYGSNLVQPDIDPDHLTQAYSFHRNFHGFSTSPNSFPRANCNSEVQLGRNGQWYVAGTSSGYPVRDTMGLHLNPPSASSAVPAYEASAFGENLRDLHSSISAQKPFANGCMGSTMRGDSRYNSEISTDPTAEGYSDFRNNMHAWRNIQEASSSREFPRDFRQMRPDQSIPCSWEQLGDDHISHMAWYGSGCRSLLWILEWRDPTATERIFNATLGSIVELMTDGCGNRLFQKLLDYCDEYQKIKIVDRVTTQEGALINAAKTNSGVGSVLKLITTVKGFPRLIPYLTSALAPEAVDLMIHPEGTKVIGYCLNQLHHRNNTFIFEAAIDNYFKLATHEKGCHILQQCINHSRYMYRQTLAWKATEQCLFLSQDPLGNYVLHCVLNLHMQDVNQNIICEQLKGSYARLSMQKHSSYIVEKCIELRAEDVVKDLLESGQLRHLVNDQYGNYIIQNAVKHTQPSVCTSEVYGFVLNSIDLMESAVDVRGPPQLQKGHDSDGYFIQILSTFGGVLRRCLIDNIQWELKTLQQNLYTRRLLKLMDGLKY